MTSHRPASTITTFGWNCSTAPLHRAGHWSATGLPGLHAGDIGSGTPWARYSGVRSTPQATMALLSMSTRYCCSGWSACSAKPSRQATESPRMVTLTGAPTGTGPAER